MLVTSLMLPSVCAGSKMLSVNAGVITAGFSLEGWICSPLYQHFPTKCHLDVFGKDSRICFTDNISSTAQWI